MPGHQHPRSRIVVTQFATAVAACLKRGRSMKPPGAGPVMTPRDHCAGGSAGHHPHAASRSCCGHHGAPGDNQKGHAAADMAGVPDMLGCPGRELADEQTPALRRPAKRGPARTRCSAHLRPVEHATNRQRVIGVRKRTGLLFLLTQRDRYSISASRTLPPICTPKVPQLLASGDAQIGSICRADTAGACRWAWYRPPG
jgi:hypothetical protein